MPNVIKMEPLKKVDLTRCFGCGRKMRPPTNKNAVFQYMRHRVGSEEQARFHFRCADEYLKRHPELIQEVIDTVYARYPGLGV
jgi:hypothetical protein